MSDYDLTLNEAKVLKGLLSGKTEPEDIADDTNMKLETVMQAAFFLEKKGFVIIEENINERYGLTDEGLDYATSGLPERQIFNFIQSNGGRVPLSVLKGTFPRFIDIGIGWLKRKKWAKIEVIGDEELVVALDAPLGDDERLIKELSDKKDYCLIEKEEYNDTLNQLKRRNLLKIREEKYRVIKLTDLGKKVAENIKIEDYDEITNVTPEIIREKRWIGMKFRRYDISIPSKEVYPAKKHPYKRIIEEMRDISLQMGFVEIKGEIVQSSFWDFDALFQPQDHPARDMQDTFYLNSESKLPKEYLSKVRDMHLNGGGIGSTGWGGNWDESLARKNVLRTHTTALSIKYLADHPNPPVKAFCIGRVYRRESIDSTHLPEFEQLEGVIMDKDLSFSHLLGYLDRFYKAMGFEKIRFRPGYFPYTEPSVEPEIYVEGLGWMELGGAGIFRREVTEPFGIKYPVLAWGIGVSRLAMLKLGLSDIRELYRSDIDWLRRKPIFNRFR